MLNFSRKKKLEKKHWKSWKRESGEILGIKYLVNLKKCLLQGFFHDFVLTIFQNFELVPVKLCQGNKKKQCIFFSQNSEKKKQSGPKTS